MAKPCCAVFEEPPGPDWSLEWNGLRAVWHIVGTNGQMLITSTAAQDGLYIEEMESTVAFISDGKMDKAAI